MTFMPRALAIMAASTWLTLLGGAGAAAEPPPERTDTPSEPAGEPAANRPAVATDLSVETSGLAPATTSTEAETETEADEVPAVKEVTLDPTAKPPVCRRYVPTGSRIASERCRSAESWDAARAAERGQIRHDIDEMRIRQAARAAAQADALRRRVGL